MPKKKKTKRAVPTKPKRKKKVAARIVSKKKTGRPSKYKPEINITVKVLAEKGFTDIEIAKAFGVSKTTVNKWKKDYPEFLASIKGGKAVADGKVERALFERATGYSHPDVHIFNHKGEAVITPIIKHHVPDVTACIFWLKNRDKDNWRDKHDVNHTGEVILRQPDIK